MQTVIAELYRVFKPYRLGDDFSGCSHCVSERESRELAAIRLRDLQAADLNRYSFKAMTTWGTVRDFKHFLPRLLELAAEDLLQLEFPETLFGKLTYGKWRSWTRREREVLQYVARGHTYREIGEQLFIAEKTVENHVRNILAKLHLNRKQELIRYALDHGIE